MEPIGPRESCDPEDQGRTKRTGVLYGGSFQPVSQQHVHVNYFSYDTDSKSHCSSPEGGGGAVVVVAVVVIGVVVVVVGVVVVLFRAKEE